MTSPSPEVKPLPCPACGSSTAQRAVAAPLWQIVCDLRDGGCGLSSRYADTREEAVLYWNRRRELESRVSPGAAPAKSLDQIKEDIAFTISQHASNISEAVLGPLVDELAADFQKQPPSSAPEEATPWKRDPLGALRLDLKASFLRENGPDLLHDVEVGNRGYNEGLRTALHLVDALERTLASSEDQTAAATKCQSCGVPWKNIALTGRHADGCADGFDRGASLSPQPAPPTTASERGAPSFCGNCGVLTFANESHWPCNGFERENRQKFYAGEYLRLTARADFSPPQPAEPTGAKNEEDMTCDRCGQSIGGAPFVRLTELRGVRHFSCAVRATHDRDDRVFRGASHPAEPETPSHSCPRCGAACICAEGFDGDPCQHYRIGCKSVAPAEPERETTRNG